VRENESWREEPEDLEVREEREKEKFT